MTDIIKQLNAISMTNTYKLHDLLDKVLSIQFVNFPENEIKFDQERVAFVSQIDEHVLVVQRDMNTFTVISRVVKDNDILAECVISVDGQFNEKYGEKLGAFDKILGAAEGNPEFSMARTAFDEYENIPEPRPEEDVYVDGLIETVEEQIDSIKESLGIEPDAKVEITQDENGDTEIKANGEVVASETEETKGEGETTEEGTEPTEEGKQGELDFDGD